MVDSPKDTTSTGLYEAAIGEKNQAYYLDKFEQFDEDGAGFHASWNWAALFGVGGVWALYRKMYGWFFATWAFGIILNMVMKLNPLPVVGLLYLAPWFCFAIFGNSFYHRKVKAQIASAQKSNADERKVIRRLNANGGVHTWVLYVVGAIPVIGIVAAIAIPAYENTAKAKFDASTAKLTVEVPPITEPVNSYGQSQEKPSQSSANASHSFSYEDAKYEEAIALLKQRDYANALKILNPLATQGHADSQWSLAWLYTNGQGVVQDVVEASKWFRLAAQQGHAGAQAGLGMAYADGRGLQRDQVKALMWQSLGALSGNPFMVDGRDRLAQSMTQQQVDQAQYMARECQRRNFKDC